jgi:phosphinothricin acetyltransferase
MARPQDAAQVASIYRPYVTDAATSFELDPPDAEEMARRIQMALRFAPWLVAEDEQNQVVGYAYASRHRERAAYQWSVDVGVYVRADQHRRGVGRALYTSQLRLQEQTAAPAAPRALAEVSLSPAWAAALRLGEDALA